MKVRDFTSGRVNVHVYAERHTLGSGPAQDEMSEAIDAEIGYRRLDPNPPATQPQTDFWTRMGHR